MILVDGKRVDSVPADDRGLAYGDGLFETLRARKGRLPLLDYHLERLFAGLGVLGIPPVPRAILEHELREAARVHPAGIVKLIVTRGSGARGYRSPVYCEARRIVMTAPVSVDTVAWRERGVVLRVCATPLEGPRALDGMKHLNRLSQVLARAEWRDPGIHEGLMRDPAGHLVEGTMSNLFVVRGNALATPPVGPGVRGVMRRLVLELAAARGIETAERFLDDAQIEAADELLITNSVIGVCPVRQLVDQRAGGLENRSYGIGTMTRLLQTETENELERLCSDD